MNFNSNWAKLMCILCVWCTCIVQSFSPRRLALGITRLSHDSGKRSVVDSNCKHFQNISQDDLGHGNVPHEAFDTMAHVKEYIYFHMRDVVICSWLTSVNIILPTHTPPQLLKNIISGDVPSYLKSILIFLSCVLDTIRLLFHDD